MTKVKCDCKACFRRVDLRKATGLPYPHADPRSGKECPGDHIPPAWRSDGIDPTPEAYKKAKEEAEKSSLTISDGS